MFQQLPSYINHCQPRMFEPSTSLTPTAVRLGSSQELAPGLVEKPVIRWGVPLLEAPEAQLDPLGLGDGGSVSHWNSKVNFLGACLMLNDVNKLQSINISIMMILLIVQGIITNHQEFHDDWLYCLAFSTAETPYVATLVAC